ncbi:PAS domain S-box protein [Rhodomicrobium sp. Az07]|uniref:PAS domain-containing protein n=1 Tax=Rhodomicrobium sp. Az07 TaxID=2839034 RepID=UPI001BEA7CD7|nr:PAS domain-containing protein [Rhodomicrobium sp. Az07]MBT3070789.1 PAS domain S-box protein [Rhodomicrobium sp. Az07]
MRETIDRPKDAASGKPCRAGLPPYATLDANGYFLGANERFCALVGRSEADLLRLRLCDLATGELAEPAPLGAIIERGLETRTHLMNGDGSAVPVTATLTPVCGGKELCFHVLVRPEASVAESETEDRRCRAVVDAVRGVLWTNNAAGEMWGDQPGWAALTGQRFEDYQGFGWKHALHPDDVQPTLDAWTAAVSTKSMFVFEHRVRRPDGQWRRYSVRALPVLDDAGDVFEWVGIHTDITEQRSAERAWLDLTANLTQRARAADEARERTWNNARDMVLITDSEGIFRAANPAWTVTLGWLPEEIVGKSMRDFLHPDDDSAATGAAFFARDGSKEIEVRFRHKDGSYRWTSWLIAPEGDLMYANGRDVTAEKEVAEALERSEARMRAIFHTSYQSKCISALDGTLLDANSTSLADIRADTVDGLVGRAFWDTPWFSETPGMAEFIRSSFADVVKGEAVRREILLTLPGGPRWFDFTMRPIRGPRGQVVSVVSEAADITTRRQAQEALLRSQRLEAVGQITGGIAHDFNNLLTPIMGAFELLQRRISPDERLHALIANAMQSAESARVLVQRLLAFARRQHLDARAVDLKSLVLGMRDLIARALGSHIVVHVEIPDGLPRARVDPSQFEVALLNLAVNGRDAMPEGGTITISASEKTVDEGMVVDLAPGRYVAFAFEDTGVGMTQEMLARAVEPFYSTKGIGKGTGLGLSMIHGLAGQSGGKLDLESEPGRGTRAMLWLPVAEAEEVVDSAPDPEPAGTEPLAVLLTDDNDFARGGAAAILEAMGHTVVQAESGACALDHLANGCACDVLVTDQRMPEMLGTELVRRARDLRPGLPAVLITGFAHEEDAEVNALPRVSKPFRFVELKRVLASALGDKGTPPEA